MEYLNHDRPPKHDPTAIVSGLIVMAIILYAAFNFLRCGE